METKNFVFKKPKRLIFTIISVSVLLLFVAVFNARAIYDNGEGIAVGIRVDVSKVGEGTWYNYTADENPGNQTLTVRPGETLSFRGTSWNAGTLDAAVTFEGVITGADYIETFNAFEGGNEDVDGTGGWYSLETLDVDNNNMVMGIGLNNHLDLAKDENDPELGAITLTLKDDIPDQTVIEGTFSLMAAQQFLVFSPFRTAHAQGALAESTVRIIVENPEADEPEDEPTTEPTTEPTITDLPQTGADNPYMKYWIISAIFIFTFVTLIVLKRVNKKEQKI